MDAYPSSDDAYFAAMGHAEDDARERQEAIAQDTVYQRDFAAMVEVYRTQIEWYQKATHIGMAAVVMEAMHAIRSGGRGYSTDQPTLQFCDDYGLPAVLRALATAIEQHQQGIPRPSSC